MGKKASLSPLAFQARVLGAKTLSRGGTALTLLLSDEHLKQISRLLECKRSSYVLEISAVPMKPEAPEQSKEKHGRAKRVQRYPYRTDS